MAATWKPGQGYSLISNTDPQRRPAKLTPQQRQEIALGWEEARHTGEYASRWDYVKAMALKHGVTASTINGLVGR